MHEGSNNVHIIQEIPTEGVVVVVVVVAVVVVPPAADSGHSLAPVPPGALGVYDGLVETATDLE